MKKLAIMFFILYFVYLCIPADGQKNFDDGVSKALAGPILALKKARYHGYIFLEQVFGSTEKEAIEGAKDYKYEDPDEKKPVLPFRYYD